MTDHEHTMAAVKGRSDFRKAYRRELECRRLLVRTLEATLKAINPKDRDGISLHEWNTRLKAATKDAQATLDAVKDYG